MRGGASVAAWCRDRRSCAVVFAHRAMAGLTDLNLNAPGQFGGKAEAGAENLQDERIAAANNLQPATEADAQRFEALCFLVIRADASHHGANAWRKFVQTNQRNRLSNGCHDKNKIGFPTVKSIMPRFRYNHRLRVVLKHKSLGDLPGCDPRRLAISCR